MNELTTTVNKTEIVIKEHLGQRVVTLKEIDEVHNRPDGTARKRFNDNKKRLVEGMDYFVRNSDEALTEYGITAPNGLTLITESGYLMLVKSFTDDLAWDVQRQLVNTYFKVSNSTPQHSRRSDRELEAADKRAAAMLLNAKSRVADNLQKLYDRAGVKAEYQAQALSGFYSTDGIDLPRIALQGTKVTYDKGTIAKRLGILSNAGNPHAQAVGAIISQLGIKPDEMEAVPYQRNGHDGTDYQYTESVVAKVRLWLEHNNYPEKIECSGKTYKVFYRKKE